MVAESYKKATLVINFRKAKLKIWLIDAHMANKAKKLVELLNEKTKHNRVDCPASIN